jgi:hypothetical protein
MDALVSYGEALLAIFMAATWGWALQRCGTTVGWRQRAVWVGLILSTVALAGDTLLSAIIYLRSLSPPEAANLRGVWTLLTGPLAVSGLILSVVGKGTGRIAAAIWSGVLMGIFLGTLLLDVNSFH